MHLQPETKKRLAEEYSFVADRMQREDDPHRVVYFFSALFTEISRILNWEWDRDLVLLHWVLQATHQNVSARTNPGSPAKNLALAAALVEPLRRVAADLAMYMAQGAEGADIYGVLGRISEIGYLSTQHGTYVMEKELIRPDSI